jgi:hypothetical protein
MCANNIFVDGKLKLLKIIVVRYIKVEKNPNSKLALSYCIYFTFINYR